MRRQNADDIEALTQESHGCVPPPRPMRSRDWRFYQPTSHARQGVGSASDSAKFYLAQLVQSDPAHPSTQAAHQAFCARTSTRRRAAATGGLRERTTLAR